MSVPARGAGTVWKRNECGKRKGQRSTGSALSWRVIDTYPPTVGSAEGWREGQGKWIRRKGGGKGGEELSVFWGLCVSEQRVIPRIVDQCRKRSL